MAVVVIAYRIVLGRLETLSFQLYGYAKNHPVFLPLVFIVLGIMGYGVGTLVAKNRAISGSGIPQVKGTILGYFNYNWFNTLWSKFIGGAIAILAGLSVGREGPSIQLGACVAEGLGDRLCDSRTERNYLIAGGASAGLAAAFNAPLAGVIFAVEELFTYISSPILLVTMVSAIVAGSIARLIFGAHPVLAFPIQNALPLSSYWMICLLGIISGGAGSLYNLVLLKTQKLYKNISNTRFRVMIPFFLAGLLSLVFPAVLGGGHAALEYLNPSSGPGFLMTLLLVKFVFSMISFGSGAPGGIFFPLLILGAIIGALFGTFSILYLGFDPAYMNNFIILAMTGFFSAIVRAPLTGIVLLLEMTGSYSSMLPLALVAIIASTTADLLKSAPVYESLLENQRKEAGSTDLPDERRTTTVDMVVHHGSLASDARIKDLSFPDDCLLTGIRRDGKEVVPRGGTLIRAGDHVTVLMHLHEEADHRDTLAKLFSVHE
ncbi:MAG: ClC family H(+)/Cl(-) exchange transporter [Spirochaetales bacterium]|nr:ClC family H(+)/Cl(-) exchange transporter [Spirochaetales bacterium]